MVKVLVDIKVEIEVNDFDYIYVIELIVPIVNDHYDVIANEEDDDADNASFC